ncbi:MAG: TlpA family protein disulfide reductase [Clostridiaceae bacterium]|nr:TlpA family protein disulfide reductase [Clostridiaceae bacterium]
MSSKIKTILYFLVLVSLISGAALVYNNLSDKITPDNPILDKKAQNTPVSTPDNSPDNTPDTNKSVDPSDKDADEDTNKTDEEDDDRLKAIDFIVYDYDGNEVALFDYIGTPIVLNFWASWCGPCRMEMPHFNKVSEEYSNDELIFLMVDLVDGQRETVEKGKNYVEENGFTFTVLFDTDQNAAYTYQIRSIPSTLFIDSEGYVEAGVEGAIDETTLRRGISLILNK